MDRFWLASYAMVLVGLGILIGLGLSRLAVEGIEPEEDAEPAVIIGPEPLRRDGGR